MQQHTKDWYRSRGIAIGEEGIPCELCTFSILNNNVDKVMCLSDIHHIDSSFRGERKHSKDGSDIIGLCSYHHREIHNKNTIYTREHLSMVVDVIKEIYSKLKHKEKIRHLVTILHEQWIMKKGKQLEKNVVDV